MEKNNIIKISLTSILCFLIFIKFYNLLLILFVWKETEMNGISIFLFFGGYALLSAMALLLLYFLFKKYLGNVPKTLSRIFGLFAIVIILTFAGYWIEYEYQNYLITLEHRSLLPNLKVRRKFLNLVLPFTGFAYFLWQIKTKKKYSG